MMGIRTQVKNWAQQVKSAQWWDSKIPPPLCILYWLWARTSEPLTFASCAFQLGLFLTSYIGLAASGHILNDYFDQRQDAQSGLSNFFHSASTKNRVFLPLAALLLALVPWCYPLANRGCASLIVLEWALFWAYSAPPLRLKERGRWAHLLDAAYGYLLPLLIPWIWQRGGDSQQLIWLALWACSVGIGQNLLHQLLDYENDRRAGTTTFVTTHGWQACLHELGCFWIPLEMVLLTILLWHTNRWALLALFLYAGLALIRQVRCALDWRGDLARFIHLDVLNWFVTGWLPWLALAGLLWRHPNLLPIAVFHYFAFANGIRTLVRYRKW